MYGGLGLTKIVQDANLRSSDFAVDRYVDFIGGQKNTKDVNSLMLFPQPSEVIVARQRLMKYFIDHCDGKYSNSKTIIKSIKKAETKHSQLLTLFSKKNTLPKIEEVSRFYTALVYNLDRLETELSHEVEMWNWATEIRKILGDYYDHSKVFGRGVNFLESKDGFYLANMVDPKNAIIFNNSFDKPEDTPPFYNGQEDVLKAQEFINLSSKLVSTLAAFYHHAETFVLCKEKNMACFPILNTKGKFEMTNAYPVATKTETPCNIDFDYTREKRHFILSGAHSGGKSELLKNIALYHLLARAGMWFPSSTGYAPVNCGVVTSFKKPNVLNKGSLESEITEIVEIERKLKCDDIALIDEFLDTTKPELARYLAEPLLMGSKELDFKGFVNSPAAVIVVDHRAPRMPNLKGFEFYYPELKEVKVDEYALVKEDGGYGGSYYDTTGNKITRLVPTHKFLKGKPNPETTRRHALQMWSETNEYRSPYVDN